MISNEHANFAKQNKKKYGQNFCFTKT